MNEALRSEIAPSREASAAWRAQVGQVAWPSILLALGALAAFAAVFAAHATGGLSWWATLLAQVPLAYVAFMPMHEAAHGNLGGSPRLRWIDTALGWAIAALFLSAYPFFRWSHLQHHAHVNDPEQDPDHWVAGPSLPVVALRCLTVIPGYYARLLRADRSRASVRRVHRATLLGMLGLAGFGATLAWIVGPAAVLVGWVLPAWLASGLLGFVFDWVPHHPHEARGRWDNCGFLAGPWARVPGIFWLTLGQSHHPVHHLFPRVPWYAYRRVSTPIREELAARGVPGAGAL